MEGAMGRLGVIGRRPGQPLGGLDLVQVRVDRPVKNRLGAEPLLIDSFVAVVVCWRLDLLSKAEPRERRAEGDQAE
jgi:hypothetical protein